MLVQHEAQGPTLHSPPGTLPAFAAGPDQLARRIALRRHPARRKRHCRIVSLEVGDFDIAGLVRLGHLGERDQHDAVGDALYRLFDETIAGG
jgi:hypothetical protein